MMNRWRYLETVSEQRGRSEPQETERGPQEPQETERGPQEPQETERGQQARPKSKTGSRYEILAEHGSGDDNTTEEDKDFATQQEDYDRDNILKVD
jgi:hypothetical protein